VAAQRQRRPYPQRSESKAQADRVGRRDGAAHGGHRLRCAPGRRGHRRRPVQQGRLQPCGRGHRSNKSLVAEYVRLTNRSAFAVNLSKWTLKDAAGHKFTFPSHIIGAHKTVYIHTGKGANGYYPAGRRDSPHLYWNSGNYIWNNTGDTATLRSASGRIYDTCSWKSGGATTYCNFKAPGPLPVTVNPAMSPVKSLPAAVEPTKPPITEPTTIKTSEVGSIPPPVTMTPPNPLPGDQACGDDPVDCVPIGVG
jgi:hypothetical protein